MLRGEEQRRVAARGVARVQQVGPLADQAVEGEQPALRRDVVHGHDVRVRLQQRPQRDVAVLRGVVRRAAALVRPFSPVRALAQQGEHAVVEARRRRVHERRHAPFSREVHGDVAVREEPPHDGEPAVAAGGDEGRRAAVVEAVDVDALHDQSHDAAVVAVRGERRRAVRLGRVAEHVDRELVGAVHAARGRERRLEGRRLVRRAVRAAERRAVHRRAPLRPVERGAARAVRERPVRAALQQQ